MRFIAPFTMLLFTTACRPDDSKADDDDMANNTADIVGDWVSEGNDMAPLFVDYTDYVALNAAFEDDGTFTVEGIYQDDSTDTFSGTYTTDLSTTPHTIVLNQVSPAAATAEGIWLIEDATLTYEVLMTIPDDTGCTVPTPEAGFGSTGCSYLNEGDNVQIYQGN